ncbi:acyl carrier protein [Streptomyces misionensis]|uniref:Acyl carrier protein n=1 Tax=Streptomyces misionensis TaxID=67331 RepID=A0A5C6JVS3_9ACTN|nr:acyl carrier protein [Streptomyces misionensis]TWV47502.1 acyl carrier protein [Streptomyces misionensis]
MDPRFSDALVPFLKFLDGKEIEPDAPLRTYGLDSMQAIELLFALEDTFEVMLPDDAMNDTTFATAGSLWEAVSAAIDAQHGLAGDAFRAAA